MPVILKWADLPGDARRFRARRRPTAHNVTDSDCEFFVLSLYNGMGACRSEDLLIEGIRGAIYPLMRSDYESAYDLEPADARPDDVLIYDGSGVLLHRVGRSLYEQRIVPSLSPK